MEVLRPLGIPPADREKEEYVVEWCLHMLCKFDGGRSEQVWDIVTGNKTFVYQYDLETKQQSSVWLFPGESPSMKFTRSRSTCKPMITVFFTKSSHVASVLLQERKTVNAKWYNYICLPKVFEAWSAHFQTPTPAACCSTMTTQVPTPPQPP